MGRDEVMELLAQMRDCASLDELRQCLPPLQEALSDIHRKRSHFLEDACAVVLKQSFAAIKRHSHTDRDDEHSQEADALVESSAVCVAFARSMIDSLPLRHANEDLDVLRQRAVIVAMLLSLLGREDFPMDGGRALADDIASLMIKTGVHFQVIVWTLRFRELVAVMRSMFLPTLSLSDSSDDEEEAAEDENEDDDDDGDDDDRAWIIHQAAQEAGYPPTLEYFIKESDQEYAFASWSSLAVVRFATLVARSPDLTTELGMVDVVSPYSILFGMGAAAQALLQDQSIEMKRQGLEILRWSLMRCEPNGLSMKNPDEAPTEATQKPFMEAFAAISDRDWISPLVELASNAMVSFPEASDRTLGLTVFRQLLLVVDARDRFPLIRRLVVRCPYGNVAAVFVDQIRNDTVVVWSSDSTPFIDSVYRSAAMSKMVVELLQLLTERDLKLSSDLLASVASLVRFLAIRDKENATGLRSEANVSSVIELFERLQSRLRATIAEVAPAVHSSDGHFHGDDVRLMLVEATLDATISLLRG